MHLPLICIRGFNKGILLAPWFSLFMDRLEKHLADRVLSHLSSREKQAIRIAGLLIPELLFADNIVFMATNP